MKRAGLMLTAAGLAAVTGACAALARAPVPQRGYAIVNDGVYPVMALQARVGADWTGNLLETPVEPGETRTLSIPDDGRPCLVDLAINTDSLQQNVFLLDHDICATPEFRVANYFDPMDEGGRGRGPGPVIERGVPLCPGDARCRRKPTG